MAEPMLTWFRRQWSPPEAFPKAWPGEWLAESRWPINRGNVGTRELFLASGPEPLRGRLVTKPETNGGVEVLRHRATTGTRGSLSWGAGGRPNGLARDLRPDDALIPVFTSDPLESDVDVLGMAEVVLEWRSPVPLATAVVRLQDVSPDGTPIQVTAGILNLTHRDGDDRPAPLPVGTAVTVHVPMRACGYRFAAGNRIRISVASSAWPVIWPSPQPADFELLGGDARLVLPTVPADGSAPVPAFRTEPPDLPVVGDGSEDPPVWRVTEDVLAGTVTVSSFEGGETVTYDGTRLYGSEGHEMTASDSDPAHARMASEVVYRLHQDGHDIEAEATAEMTSTATDFRLRGELRVRLDGEPFHTRAWDEQIPRDLA
jgi:hypothetical protein